MAKFKFAVISGVVAVQCARHGFYMPDGMVDLKKGEAFANTDYAICRSLQEASCQRFIMVTYDIWCQYSIKLESHVSKLFQRMLPIFKRIRGAIPKMHIHNHQDACEILWNLNWLMYSAATAGEMIETGWAEQNLMAGSTKEQNDGHRHDSIDDMSGNWNWDKLIKLNALVRLYRICALEERRRTIDFEGCTSVAPEGLVAVWEKMDVEPKMVDGKLISVFQADIKNGPPTHAAAYAKLVAEEVEAEKSGLANQTGDTALIGTALLIEKEQIELGRKIAQKADADVVHIDRRRLTQDLTDLRRRQVQRAPQLAELMKDIDLEKPEKEALFLPSEYSESMRNDLKLGALAQVEYTLREGHAFEALRDVKLAIRTLNLNFAWKRSNIHGTGANTRTQNYLKTLENDVQIAATTYRRMHQALVRLGLPDNDPVLKPLLPEHLRGKDGLAQAAGQVKQSDPWFWRTGRPRGLTDEEEAEWNTEMDRVKWFRVRALLQRSQEERETLEEEFGRAVESFHKSANIWSALAEGQKEKAGAQAYAEKQADMYRELASRCFIARGTLAQKVAEDLKKQQAKEAREAQRAQKTSTSREEEEELWDTLSKVDLRSSDS
ncbi:hypothetical protein DFH07DRAFT_766411 [Mycena maculata]|uniref:Uncharacterized protein n=1 Tax=Mycena maculata TaxID=230809 RepID=A0AAD7K3X6_9AGAR|nr:hypothetical protein DFH07DRAFT_766411 [Mycena maculata]